MRRIAKLVLVLSTTALSAPALAAQADLDVIKAQCAKQLKLSAAGCGCVVKQASELSDGQQAFAAAVLGQDKAKMAELEKGLLPDDLARVGQFMTTAQAKCK